MHRFGRWIKNWGKPHGSFGSFRIVASGTVPARGLPKLLRPGNSRTVNGYLGFWERRSEAEIVESVTAFPHSPGQSVAQRGYRINSSQALELRARGLVAIDRGLHRLRGLFWGEGEGLRQDKGIGAFMALAGLRVRGSLARGGPKNPTAARSISSECLGLPKIRLSCTNSWV